MVPDDHRTYAHHDHSRIRTLFAVVTAAHILGERSTVRGWVGAALMIAGSYVVLVLAPPEDADIRTAEALSEAH